MGQDKKGEKVGGVWREREREREREERAEGGKSCGRELKRNINVQLDTFQKQVQVGMPSYKYGLKAR